MGRADITGSEQAPIQIGTVWLSSTSGNMAVGSSFVVNGVRPALKLDRSKIAFVSAATGGTPFESSNLSAYGGVTAGNLKLAVIDNSYEAGFNLTNTGSGTLSPSGNLTVDYQGVTGTGNSIRCKLVDSLGNVKYYGNLKNNPPANGSFTINGGALTIGRYTAYVWVG